MTDELTFCFGMAHAKIRITKEYFAEFCASMIAMIESITVFVTNLKYCTLIDLPFHFKFLQLKSHGGIQNSLFENKVC